MPRGARRERVGGEGTHSAWVVCTHVGNIAVILEGTLEGLEARTRPLLMSKGSSAGCPCGLQREALGGVAIAARERPPPRPPHCPPSQRWNHHLRPDIRKEPWTRREEQQLVEVGGDRLLLLRGPFAQ